MAGQQQRKIFALIQKGVRIPAPESVEIGEDVQVERISGESVTVHAGCRIWGKYTWISGGAVLGHEAPATMENCHIGPGVSLGGGFFRESVFLEKASVGSGAQIREGTILEEFSKAAHCVGLKQTILFPYVTLGSLINFCDCLMTGGTDSKNHSEVGSSYIHFNYTPQQDKATASLIGNVYEGVMLDQPPIFLGGQGGLVGPCRLAHGSVVAAGAICRKDEIRKNRLIFEGTAKSTNVVYTAGGYRNIRRIFVNNMIYIANLFALEKWYDNIRRRFVPDGLPEELYRGLRRQLNCAIDERIKRMGEFVENISKFSIGSAQSIQERDLISSWPGMKHRLEDRASFTGEKALRDRLVQALEKKMAGTNMDYIKTIQQLPAAEKRSGTSWLESIVNSVLAKAGEMVPGLIIQS